MWNIAAAIQDIIVQHFTLVVTPLLHIVLMDHMFYMTPQKQHKTCMP